ncbi:hypothetical protein [Methylosinus sp. R-45379]|uniref:hypothetical protein n=1 Tax=Methylosinus sp. R-45379 TaxID=980563 RepID=UPI0018DEA708|nr:hypothetical protein [Methylosinus sp. R-45379]
MTNEPRRGFGAKAMKAVESEASFRGVSLLRALDTATLPTKCRMRSCRSATASEPFAQALRKAAKKQGGIQTH